jgi:hypothetical protein
VKIVVADVGAEAVNEVDAVVVVTVVTVAVTVAAVVVAGTGIGTLMDAMPPLPKLTWMTRLLSPRSRDMPKKQDHHP